MIYIKKIRQSMSLLTLAILLAPAMLAATMSNADAAPMPESFADLVEQKTPAVVNISTTQKIKTSMLAFPGIQDPEMEERFREFFGKMLPPGASPFGGGENGEPLEREAQSLGSGFIIDPNGYVVTNNHVIADASEITVILSDDTKLPAEIVGRDVKTDLALLKVKTDKKLPSLTFGDSNVARVGDWVIAIGNPFGLGGTVTAGIISARARNINAGPFDDFIQTDASINRGNSGGPLFNTAGEVIGITTAIFSPSGGSIGIGFAVPSALAKSVLDQLKEHGRAIRGWLGVKIQTVSDEIAESLDMPKSGGALVGEVNTGSPAEKAGIEVGDVILKFDGKDIQAMHFLPRIVAETPIGKKVDVVLRRGGKEKTVQVTLGELKEDEIQQASKEEEPATPKVSMDTFETSGMTLAAVNEALRQQLDLPKDSQGVVIIDILHGGAASKQGLAKDDRIIRLGETDTPDLTAFKTALANARKSGRKNALLRVMRGETLLFITIPTEEEKKDEKKD